MSLLVLELQNDSVLSCESVRTSGRLRPHHQPPLHLLWYRRHISSVYTIRVLDAPFTPIDGNVFQPLRTPARLAPCLLADMELGSFPMWCVVRALMSDSPLPLIATYSVVYSHKALLIYP